MARKTKAVKQEPQVDVGAEIFASLRELEKVKGIPVEYMVDRLKQALTNAYRRDREDHKDLPADNVVVNLDEHGLSIHLVKTAVEQENLEDLALEIPLDAARRYKPDAQPGDPVSIPVDIHSHYTAGLASMSILKGIEAGADIIDTAMSPLSLGTSHMPTESLVAALQGTDYDTGLDLKQLNVVRAYFAKLREKYIANGQISPKSLGVDANTLLYQVPGGMFSNMLKQLKDAGKEDKLDEVLAEIPRVREDAGYPPLVTPTSQIVGTQAVFNVILGERYKMVTKEFKGLVHGDYGKTPAPISAEFTKKILGDEKPITCRFADTLAPEMDKLKTEAAKWATQEEDVLTYAMFPQVAPKFFEKRNAKKQGVDADHADYTNQSHPV